MDRNALLSVPPVPVCCHSSDSALSPAFGCFQIQSTTAEHCFETRTDLCSDS